MLFSSHYRSSFAAKSPIPTPIAESPQLTTDRVQELAMTRSEEDLLACGCSPTWAALGVRDFFATGIPPAIDAEFRRQWRIAVSLYLGEPDGSGADWPAARLQLEALAAVCPPAHSGPGAALISGMEALSTADGKAPRNWPGYRILQEK